DVEERGYRDVIVVARNRVHRTGALAAFPQVCGSCRGGPTQQKRRVKLIACAAVALRYEHAADGVADLGAGSSLLRPMVTRVLSKQRRKDCLFIEARGRAKRKASRGASPGVGKEVFGRVLLEVIVVLQLLQHPTHGCRSI